MKLKLVMFAIPFVAFGTMSFTGGAKPAYTETYAVSTCMVDNADGTYSMGSQCNLPDPNGPCSRQTACHLNP